MGDAIETGRMLWATLAAAAAAHPLIAAMAGLAALGAIGVARRAAVVPVAGFLAVAAVVGLEPVEAAALRYLFAAGCLAALGLLGALARR